MDLVKDTCGMRKLSNCIKADIQVVTTCQLILPRRVAWSLTFARTGFSQRTEHETFQRSEELHVNVFCKKQFGNLQKQFWDGCCSIPTILITSGKIGAHDSTPLT